jgi:hypothetical protein
METTTAVESPTAMESPTVTTLGKNELRRRAERDRNDDYGEDS